MNKRDLNIAIIGGGPAGLMTAILLSRKGIRSTVVERGKWPVDKVCGEGIMPLGVSLLEKYDLLRYIDKKWSRSFNGIRYINNDGQMAFGEFQNEPGLVVRRLALSSALFEAASIEENVTLIPQHDLINFTEAKEHVEIALKCKATGGEKTLSGFTYLIGADGLRSRVRKLNEMDGTIPGKQKNRMGARVHYELEPWDNKVQIWWQNGIESYVAPVSEKCVEFNFGWDHDVLAPQKMGTSLEAGLFSYFPELQRKVNGAKKLSPLKSWGPLPHRAKAPIIGRIALIGDSGLFYDQITGEGLSLAFVQAELVANTIENWDSPEGRSVFVDTLTSVGDKYIQITDFAMFFTRHPSCRRLMVWLLSRSPKLFSHLLHVNMGEFPLLRPPITLVMQALFFPQKKESTK